MPADAVTVYWRPGCLYCKGLFRSLDRIGLEPGATHDIWEDDDAAAYVRSVAGGNETVPTVVVGETPLVNPSGREVVQRLAEVAPGQVPEGQPPAPGPVSRLLDRALGGASPTS